MVLEAAALDGPDLGLAPGAAAERADAAVLMGVVVTARAFP